MELLLNMTIGGTVTACMLLLVKMALKNKLTPKWHFYLWIILAIRLMVPGLPESDISLLNTIPTAQNITVVERLVPNSTNESEAVSTSYVEGKITMKTPVTGMERKTSFTLTRQKAEGAVFGWVAGMILMAVYLIGAYWIFYKRAKRLPECKDKELLELLEECKGDVGVASSKITLRLGGTTPILQGIFHPTILVPEGYSKEELRHILIHELCHYKHKDILINMICCGFLCAYWFNPIMWLCFYVLRRDIEILCDERVIEITGERKEYAKVLLRTALRKNQFLFATTSMQNGEKEVAKRIKHIAYFKKPKLWISLLAVFVVGITGVICLTNASTTNTVNLEVGGGYFMKIPGDWIKEAHGETLFYNDAGESFGGTSMVAMDLGENKAERFESFSLPIPNHAEVLERRVIKEMDRTIIIINLDLDSETAAQIAERNASGDDSPSQKINQNYVFLLPDVRVDEVVTIWANNSEVKERQLLKIAKSLQQNPYPQGDQPEAPFKDDWANTADRLLKAYFKNYADAEMSMSSDISGYQITDMEQCEDEEASWSMMYPNAAVFRVDYSLEIAYPDQYSFAGGGFQIGEGDQTKIYKDQLAVFQMDGIDTAKFLGFVWPQDLEEMGEASAILYTINYRSLETRAEALLDYKTLYIGDHSKVGGIVRNLPLAQFGAGIELHTKEEPYGVTVNYDLTALGGDIFETRVGKAATDSSGWEPNPYLKAQLYQNSVILLSLIDNCSTVEFKITGLSELGAPYTYYYLTDRETINLQFTQDPRGSTDSMETFSEFLSLLEQSQTNME